MEYLLCKLKFPNGLHIGEANINSLESTNISVYSDTFFSALYSEYIKLYNDIKFLEIVKNDEFKISDLLPFKKTFENKEYFYLPKPYVNIERKKQEISNKMVDRKKVKALSYIPAHKLKDYFSFLENGENFPDIDNDFGEKQLYTKNKISKENKDTELYNIEVFKFNKDSGLYFVVKLPENNVEIWKEKFFNILDSLSLSGIGGKKTTGFGQFNFEIISLNLIDNFNSEDIKFIKTALEKEEKNYLIISSYAPLSEEIEKIKEKNNCYQLIKRSGFVNSSLYSKTFQKRKSIYMIASGAVLNFKPKGRLVDLKLNGAHSIYRLGKPIILGVSLCQK